MNWRRNKGNPTPDGPGRIKRGPLAASLRDSLRALGLLHDDLQLAELPFLGNFEDGLPRSGQG
jgi:hypothetical protein